jgi:O-antigen ligase
LTVFGFIAVNAITEFLENEFPLIYNRFINIQADGSTHERIAAYNDAWKQFINAPIVSSDFVLTSGIGRGWYPHNIVLESLIALGIIGGIIIIVLLTKGISNTMMTFRKKQIEGFIGIIFMQYMILHMVSSCIYGGSIFFTLISYMLSNSYFKKYDKTFSVSESQISISNNQI